MSEVGCVDGRVLSVLAVPLLDHDGTAYETTLRLLLDGEALGDVTERCGAFLRAAAEQLRSDRPAGPSDGLEAGVRRWAGHALLDPDQAWRSLAPYLPRDRELFCFRSRDPDDGDGRGELRARLQDDRTWVPGTGGARGRWRHDRRVVLEAWGTAGQGVRALLTPAQLLALVEGLLD